MSPFHLRQTVDLIRCGGILAYPTEAVYGLGCDPLEPIAVQRILEFKNRPVHKGLILIGSHFSQFEPFVLPLEDPVRMDAVLLSWPGPHTWLMSARPECPTWLTGQHSTLGVRVTDHPVAAAICHAARMPLVSTSANASGRPPARTALQARLRCGSLIDGVVSGDTDRRLRPSSIRDAATGHFMRH